MRTLRQALESPHVSRELPGWIDLVFGCLQQGDGAAQALNLFLPCTYVGAVELAPPRAVLGGEQSHERAGHQQRSDHDLYEQCSERGGPIGHQQERHLKPDA